MIRSPWAPCLALLLAACAPPAPVAPPVPVTEVAFDPAFAIDLAAMTRTPGGVYYRDDVVGEGFAAQRGQRVSVLYVGWLANGTRIDAAVSRDAPFSFRLGDRAVIRGWDEGIRGMRVGGRRLLVVPAELGYGNRRKGEVPANSTLVFLVDLIGVG